MKAVILLSGGMDSATVLYAAKAEGCECYALSFDYQQRHLRELEAAKDLAVSAGVKAHQIVRFDLRSWGGSALTDENLDVPEGRSTDEMSAGIPITYVPARNTIFLSFALGYAEAIGAKEVRIGANAIDYSGYPDCRPDYMEAMQEVYRLGTKQGREGDPITIVSPLIHLTKADIVRLGTELGVPWEKTWSCYTGGEVACGVCDACQLRLKGFREAGVEDAIVYHS